MGDVGSDWQRVEDTLPPNYRPLVGSNVLLSDWFFEPDDADPNQLHQYAWLEYNAPSALGVRVRLELRVTMAEVREVLSSAARNRLVFPSVQVLRRDGASGRGESARLGRGGGTSGRGDHAGLERGGGASSGGRSRSPMRNRTDAGRRNRATSLGHAFVDPEVQRRTPGEAGTPDHEDPAQRPA